MIKLFKLLIPRKKEMTITAALFLINSLAGLALPTIMSEIVDTGIDSGNFDYIVKACILMFVIAVIGLVSYIFAVKTGVKVTSEFAYNIKKKVFHKAVMLPYSEYNKIGTGTLISRSTQDIWIIQEVASSLLYGMFTIPAMIIGGTILALTKDVYLSLVLFAFAPVMVVVVKLVSRKLVPLWQTSDEYIDKQNAIIRERLHGIRVIRAFNREDTECARADHATRVMAKNIINANVRMGAISPIAMLVLNIATVLIVYIGAVRIQNPTSSLTAGAVIAVVQYIVLVMNGILNLSFTIAMIPQANVNAKRINAVLDIESEDIESEQDVPELIGDIEIKDMSFKYEGADEASLSEINMSVKAGSKIAVIGGTGSGKSTLVMLLSGFYAPTSGSITLGGVDYKKLSGNAIRQNISIALQKPAIFKGSIGENIGLGREGASDEDIMDAAKTAQISDFIDAQAEGYDYQLQTGGTNLSGGQKQRVSIARAILKKAAVYIFDDSFSALDFLTEAKLKSALAEKIRGKTQIIVTQRITSAMGADEIFVMDRGIIIGHGRHAELLNNCSVYKEIYLSQTGGAL